MQILFVAAEAAPIAKVGGMGDVVGVLPRVLRELGHDVRICLPYYGFLPDELSIPAAPVWQGRALGQAFGVYETVLPGTTVPLYLVGHAAFEPRRIYHGDDEGWRFTLFARAATELCWHYWQPQIVHCHDWHTGAIPVWLRHSSAIATVLTIHNLAYQGPTRERLAQFVSLPSEVQGHNIMAAAIHHADRINTVSPTYARQIQTPEYGESLDALLAAQSDKLVGIVNGIDTVSFDPASDDHIPQPYTAQTLEQRAANKAALQSAFGLSAEPQTFTIGMVSRLVEQKGLDLVLQSLGWFLAYTDAQFAVLGTGEARYETQLWDLAARHPGRMAVQLLYNDRLSRWVYAGSDAFLMPSRFEPCGISQMLAMRYGCVPIVRHTGGLVDTVAPHDPAAGAGTGYCFQGYDALALYTCLVRTREGFAHAQSWQQLQQRGMQQDFSWYRSARAYAGTYKTLLGLPLAADERQPALVADAEA
ncbi:MAG: glycogen synthase GlgA [Cyanobacteria bacterium QS_8_64_29]|nr:MAG: glycogen synthase GlgA [Cyanobacteria bacterium QS_8_64_29]